MNDDFLEILRCPACRAELRAEDESLVCRSEACGLRYPVVDGIPHLLISEGKPSADA